MDAIEVKYTNIKYSPRRNTQLTVVSDAKTMKGLTKLIYNTPRTDRFLVSRKKADKTDHTQRSPKMSILQKY